MRFQYFYGSEAEKYSFIRIPVRLVTDPAFSDLSIQAKLIYGMLLDRMGISLKNEWIDKERRVYVIYPVAELQSDLGLSKRKTMECLAELETKGLIEKQMRGSGLPNILYVKSVAVA